MLRSTSGGILTVDEIVPEFFKNGLPLDKVSHAELGTMANTENVVYGLGNLPALSYIRVEPQSGLPFINALYPHSNAVDAQYFPLYFKNLLSISLGGRQGVAVKREDLGLLQDCLIQRYECGAEIPKLILHDCYYYCISDIEELQNIVVDVDWDGKHQDLCNNEDYEVDSDYEVNSDYSL